MFEPLESQQKRGAPAVGQFGVTRREEAIAEHVYRPAGCPSLDQFEERYAVGAVCAVRPASR